MNKNGPVIIIEDDEDDRMFLEEIFENLAFKNKIIFFEDGKSALDYLNKTKDIPFIILSDINIPKINGFELRKQIYENEKLHLKCIPYLFLTTNANKASVGEAYAMAVQGFFVKPNSHEKLESTIKKIMEYWQECIAPSEYEES